jgi:hypothetical protein
MHCDQQEALRRNAMGILERIDRLTSEQLKAMRDRDDDLLLNLDKQIEAAFGEKERAFGALLHHRDEHGC